jgi:hypothetical protein
MNQFDREPAQMDQVFDRSLIDQSDAGQIDSHLLMPLSRIIHYLIDHMACFGSQSSCNTDRQSAVF